MVLNFNPPGHEQPGPKDFHNPAVHRVKTHLLNTDRHGPENIFGTMGSNLFLNFQLFLTFMSFPDKKAFISSMV
ncbi:hypothetical protein SAMN02746065_101106 [Desulfocicer vacuolatum DSM 3385]|uniref:Uncharacterized protein n=1 Tax=Desulfocicer vacuolatum DSM 3385 TaxID=1121400 RepID=A0A1W1YJI2_9BACT|nr:hypothetical protein SAMN02746065_101106 [Desulfocicer vacuolatum DSM 3385]